MGPLWESDTNMEVVLLENDIVKLQNTSVFTRLQLTTTLNELTKLQKQKNIMYVQLPAYYTIKHVFPLNQVY